MRPTRLALVAVITAAMVIGLVPVASAVPKRDRATLMEYAEDTWRSFEAMVEPSTGLVADNIEGDLEPATRSAFTSPTNIGGYLWSTVVARDLRIINRREAYQRMSQTLDSVAQLERHEASVRPDDARGAARLAGGRQHGLPIPIKCGQRVVGRGADGGR